MTADGSIDKAYLKTFLSERLFFMAKHKNVKTS